MQGFALSVEPIHGHARVAVPRFDALDPLEEAVELAVGGNGNLLEFAELAGPLPRKLVCQARADTFSRPLARGQFV